MINININLLFKKKIDRFLSIISKIILNKICYINKKNFKIRFSILNIFNIFILNLIL